MDHFVAVKFFPKRVGFMDVYFGDIVDIYLPPAGNGVDDWTCAFPAVGQNDFRRVPGDDLFSKFMAGAQGQALHQDLLRIHRAEPAVHRDF